MANSEGSLAAPNPIHAQGAGYIPVIPNWHREIAKEKDPSDREILAYKFGKMAGKEEERERTIKEFYANLEISCYFAQSFYDYISKEVKIKCESASIRPIGFSSFQGIFIIHFDDYKNRELRTQLYDKGHEIGQTLKQKNIQIEFLFMTVSESFDKADLLSDGYFWTYSGDGKG